MIPQSPTNTRVASTAGPARHVVCPAVLLLLLSGCNLAPKYLGPKNDLPTEFKTEGPWRTAKPSDDQDRGSWWSAFGDSRLAGLMKQAENGSPTLEAALHRVDEARALARADSAGLFPFLNFGSSAQRNRGTGTLQFQFAGGRTRTVLTTQLDLQYELDLWGRVRNQSRAGRARSEIAGSDYENVLLSLRSELAINYFALQAQDELIDLLRRNVALRQKTVDLARTRFQQGDIAQIDVAQAETDLNATQAEAIGLERRRAELEHAIALLLGKTPSDFSLPSMSLRSSPPSVPKSVPSDLLERRPDIAAAERTMAGLNAEIGVARAALFPSLTVGATGGRQSSFLSQLGQAPSRIWGLGPAALDWPLFQGGGAKGRLEAARARYDTAASDYRQTVLNAVREVEDALAGLSILKRQLAAQETTVKSASQALTLSQKRYTSGLVDYYEVLDSQRTLLQAEREATRLKGEIWVTTVILIKALGGGW